MEIDKAQATRLAMAITKVLMDEHAGPTESLAALTVAIEMVAESAAAAEQAVLKAYALGNVESILQGILTADTLAPRKPS